MDLLERYLQAVKFWLPKNQQNDIVAELSEDIRSEIEEKESGLGRKLSDSELSALLKKRGRPMLVAMSYRPKRYLIGPSLFPMYWFVLRLAMACFLIPWALTGTLMLVFGTSSRSAGQVFGSLWGSLWGGLGMQFLIITAVFAAIEHYATIGGVLHDWNPTKLPAVRPAKDPFRVSRFAAATELVLGVIFLIWWMVLPQSLPFSFAFNKAGLPLNWGPVWMDFHTHFYFHVIFLTVLGIGVNASNLITAHWTRPRLAIRAGINASMSLIAYFVVRAHWAEVQAQLRTFDATMNHLPDAEKITMIINLSIYLALSITVVATGIQCLTELVRMAKLNGGKAAMKAAAVAFAAFLTAGTAAAQVVGNGSHSPCLTGSPSFGERVASVAADAWAVQSLVNGTKEAASCAVRQLNRVI